jgi:hypothetical protein
MTALKLIRNFYFIISVLLSIIFISCDQDEIEKDDTYTFSGSVFEYPDKIPAQGLEIKLITDQVLNETILSSTLTDSTGKYFFKIPKKEFETAFLGRYSVFVNKAGFIPSKNYRSIQSSEIFGPRPTHYEEDIFLGRKTSLTIYTYHSYETGIDSAYLTIYRNSEKTYYPAYHFKFFRTDKYYEYLNEDYINSSIKPLGQKRVIDLSYDPDPMLTFKWERFIAGDSNHTVSNKSLILDKDLIMDFD